MRWVFRIIGTILVLVILAVGALFLLPADRIANLAARQFEAATGRALTIDGDVTPTFWPVLGARVEGVTLANVASSDAGPMLRADSVDLGVDLAQLLQGNLVVRQFEARAPQIVLERDQFGVGNWNFAGVGDENAAATETGTRSTLPPIILDRAQIQGASLRYIDRAAGTDVTVEGVSIDLAMPEAGGPAELRISIDRNGQQGEVSATLASVDRLMAGEVVAVDASISTEGAQGSFEGRMGIEPVAAEGRLSIQIDRLGPALQMAGAEGGEPLPGAARPLALSGQLTLAPAGSVHLREGSIGIGANRLAVALDTTFRGRAAPYRRSGQRAIARPDGLHGRRKRGRVGQRLAHRAYRRLGAGAGRCADRPDTGAGEYGLWHDRRGARLADHRPCARGDRAERGCAPSTARCRAIWWPITATACLWAATCR